MQERDSPFIEYFGGADEALAKRDKATAFGGESDDDTIGYDSMGQNKGAEVPTVHIELMSIW